METCMNKLTHFLKDPKELSVVVMPDFFLDRLVSIEQDPPCFAEVVRKIADRKGGSIDGVHQTDIRGGNAVNVASALATIGAKVVPIVCTSQLGLELLKYHLEPLGADLSHVRVCSSASTTTALELSGAESKVNIMLRDLGSLEDFGPTNLSDDDYDTVLKSDFVCLFNWAGTRNHGTALAHKVFGHAKAKSNAKTYFDPADPNPNPDQIFDLIEKVLKGQDLDVLSLNENEAITYAEYLTKENLLQKNHRLEEVALEAARLLAKQLSARIDLHTTEFSATFTKHSETLVPAFKINALRATGAGDAWDAGNIFAYRNNLSDECRLTLANAISACYLKDPEGTHPTRKQIIQFLETHPETRTVSRRAQ